MVHHPLIADDVSFRLLAAMERIQLSWRVHGGGFGGTRTCRWLRIAQAVKFSSRTITSESKASHLTLDGQYMRVATILIMTVLATSAAWVSARTLEVQDVLNLERIDSFSIAPGEAWVAYVRARPFIAEKTYQEDMGGSGLARSDIWILRPGAEKPRNLTHGESDGSGWFMPLWSPDGRYLTFASTRGTEGVRLYIWDSHHDEMRMLSTMSVDPMSTRWLHDDSLVAVALGNDEPWAWLAPNRMAGQAAARQWQQHWDLGKATASAVNSGQKAPSFDMRRQDALVVVQADGKMRKVASGVQLRVTGLAPDRRKVAFAYARNVVRLDPAQPLPFRYRQSQYDMTVGVFDPTSGRVAAVPDTIQHVDERTIAWSADGRRLAFLANLAGKPMNDAALVTCEISQPLPATLHCATVAGEVPGEAFGWHVMPTLLWNGDTILFHAQPKANLALRPNFHRNDWYAFVPGQPMKVMTKSIKQPPARVVPVSSALLHAEASVVAVADGQLVRFYEDGRTAPMRLASGRTVRAIEWTDADAAGAEGDFATATHAIVVVDGEAATSHRYLVDLRNGSATELREGPSPTAGVAAASATGSTIILTDRTDTGTFAWIGGNDTAWKRFAAINTFLKDVDLGAAQSYTYSTQSGLSVTGWILLPPGHMPGQRHPTLMWVYPGRILNGVVPEEMRVDFPFPFINLQLFAAHGYAVIIPSMPIGDSPPRPQLLGSILPALDRAIALGLVDPERVAIGGHSAGGYTTYSVITQTDRFKAAIALAGLTNFTSEYGAFSPEVRYSDEAPEDHYLGGGLETRFGGINIGLDAPPWKEPGLYVDNSPVMHVDKVNTPILMVHGDLDVVPIQSAEQFFSGLYRLNKTAQFVRYWGEGHNITRPANVIDLWQRSYAWLDHYLSQP